MSKREKELRNTIAEQNVIIDTLRISLLRAERVIKDEKDQNYVFTKSSKWAMSVDAL